MNSIQFKIFTVFGLLFLYSCGERGLSDLSAAKVDNLSGDNFYSLLVEEHPNNTGYAKVRVTGQPDPREPMAITGCIGHLPACRSGYAREFIMYASPATFSASQTTPEKLQLPPASVSRTQGSILEFPFPVHFKQGVVFNITTYYAPVRIVSGWIVGIEKSAPAASEFSQTAPLAQHQAQIQQLQSGFDALRKLAINDVKTSVFQISEDWQSSFLSQIANQLNQQQWNEVLPSQPHQSPAPGVPSIPNPSPSGPGNMTTGDILNQGRTNYCWGYSAFHMTRQYYLNVDPNGAWAQALSKINTTEGMANYMRENHTNRGNHMMTWIKKFRQNNSLPADGWNWSGGAEEAARKLQQNPPIPASYCDGRHCTALIEFSNGQFTVADSSGGYTYKAGTSKLGGHNVVTSSASALPNGTATSPLQPQSPQNAAPLQQQAIGQGLSALFQ